MALASTVEKRLVINVGGGASVTHSLKQDVTGISREDIRQMMIRVVGEETARQINLDNPPTITEVDNSKSKPVSAAQKKVVVLFGTTMDRSALDAFEKELQRSIDNSTTARTGALRDVGNTWEWMLLRQGRRVAIGDKINFGPRDVLILKPKLSYASVVNSLVAGGGSLNYSRAKRNQKLGFMAYTARRMRQHRAWTQFSVSVGITKRFPVRNEVYRHGTFYFMIVPRRRRQFRR